MSIDLRNHAFIGCMLVAFCLGSSPTRAQGLASEAASQAVKPEEVKWVRNPLVPGVASASVVGDPAKPGLYVLLGRMDKGTIFPAHRHPDARITTVISGVMYYGTGPVADRETMQAYPAGSIVHTPSGIPHSMWSRDGETVMQETGFGPTGMQPAVP